MNKLILFAGGEDTYVFDHLLSLARYIHLNVSHRIYFVHNVSNRVIDSSFGLFIDDVDPSFFNDSDIILPVDDFFSLLPLLIGASNASIHFYFYNEYSIERIKKRYQRPNEKDNKQINELFKSDYYYCANYLSYSKVKNKLKREITPIYIPFSTGADQKQTDRPTMGEINVAWVGPIHDGTLGSFVTMCNDLSDMYEKYGNVYIHIIGGGKSFWKIDFKNYSSRLFFVFPNLDSYEEEALYLTSNVDVIFSVNRALFVYSNLGIPSYMIPLSRTVFNGNYVKFCDL